MATKISWCDETINPIVGCSKISAGCQNCYAENMARRLAAMGMGQYQSVISFGRWNGLTAFVESELWKPHKWKKPRSIFISSMGDLFHDTVNIKWQLDVLDMVYGCPQHTFIVLTKRPENMKRVIYAYTKENGQIPNLVLGVSVEDQQTVNDRVPVLIATPAAKRFVSLEPMVGPVSFRWMCAWPENAPTTAQCPSGVTNHLDGLRRLDGVILGGESGNKGRRMEPLWVAAVRDQCAESGVPFMFKQWNHENRNEVDPETGFPWLVNRTHSDLAW